MTINCVCCSQWDEIQKKIQSNMEAALFASMDKINGFGNLFHTELGKFYEKPIM